MLISSREFDRIADLAFARIPPMFRRRLRNVLIVVEQEPPQPGILGLYQGRPLTERSVFDASSGPDKITIYQGPIEEDCADEAEMAEVIRETVIHEVGHYFGLDDETMHRIEDGDDDA